MAMGVFAVMASLGMLLFTLKVVDQTKSGTQGETISQLTFESLLRQGEVVECTLEYGRLTGLRQGAESGTTERFAVDGEIPSSLLRRIARYGVPLRRLDMKVVRKTGPAAVPAPPKQPRPKPPRPKPPQPKPPEPKTTK
jgi:hypothetical protein